MFKNKTILIIALIAVVNALGYGIIIPVLYSYSMKFGLTDFQNGLLFAIFSLCQFLATPVIGRLSDKYGRKPLLIISLIGTAISFFMTAFAPSALFLFLARALDGVTAGNIPVAAAVISDSTDMKDRARGFGIIGAAFGFGFVFGPAIAAFTVGFNAAIPFIIAGVISTIAVVITWALLPETNKHIGQVIHKGKLFDFKKLALAVKDQYTGMTLLISFLFSFAFGMFIFGFQPFSVKIMKLSPNEISLIFTIFGIVGLITQAFLLGMLTKKFGEKRMFMVSLVLTGLAFLGIFVTSTLPFFIAVSILLSFGNSFLNPLVQTILSKETDVQSQGTIQGINASYVSIGMTLGPIVGGLLATYYIPNPFLAGGIIILACFILSFKIKLSPKKKEHLF